MKWIDRVRAWFHLADRKPAGHHRVGRTRPSRIKIDRLDDGVFSTNVYVVDENGVTTAEITDRVTQVEITQHAGSVAMAKITLLDPVLAWVGQAWLGTIAAGEAEGVEEIRIQVPGLETQEPGITEPALVALTDQNGKPLALPGGWRLVPQEDPSYPIWELRIPVADQPLPAECEAEGCHCEVKPYCKRHGLDGHLSATGAIAPPSARAKTKKPATGDQILPGQPTGSDDYPETDQQGPA